MTRWVSTKKLRNISWLGHLHRTEKEEGKWDNEDKPNEYAHENGQPGLELGSDGEEGFDKEAWGWKEGGEQSSMADRTIR